LDAKPHDLAGELRSDYAYEATVAELVDRVDAQAHELVHVHTKMNELRREREELKTELMMAQGWVRELATALEEAEARLAARESTLRDRIAPQLLS
jgi:uncharacterized coiled-coil DUF342 family protein